MSAEGEGTSFENPAYDPDGLGDDDDDEGGDANEMTPFLPGESSTPYGQQEKIPMQAMQREKSGLPATAYAETCFTGAQTLSEQAWVAAKGLYPNMSSSELEVSYSSKGKHQVKMFRAGKKTYDLFTKNRRMGRDQINQNLSKEIKAALGPKAEDIIVEDCDTIREQRQRLTDAEIQLQQAETFCSQREEEKKAVEALRRKIVQTDDQIDALQDKYGSNLESEAELRRLKQRKKNYQTDLECRKKALDSLTKKAMAIEKEQAKADRLRASIAAKETETNAMEERLNSTKPLDDLKEQESEL